MTMLSRVLGLVRDVVFAAFLGATANADAFFVAFKIPNFLRRLFAEGAFSQAFIPVLADYKEEGSVVAVRALINRVAGVLGGTVMLVSALGVLAAPAVASIFAPGFIGDPHKFQLTTQMIRITFPYLFLISMTGFCGAILNSYGRFSVPAITPIFLNISLILSAVVVSPWFDEPVFALAWGVFLAGIVQLLFQLPFLYKLDLLPKPQWNTQDEGVRRIMKLMVPALFGVSVSQLNLLLDTVLASFLPTGSVSWLYYSDRLAELPLGVFGVAIATVILPNLSAHNSASREHLFASTLDWAVRLVLLIAIPSATALIILAEPILITLFQYNAFTTSDVAMAAWSLRAYSIGVIAFMLIKVLAPGFYARQDISTPVAIGIKAMVANMIMNFMFVLPLMYYWNLGHVGLALATSAAAYLNAGLLLKGLVQRGIFSFQPGWWRYSARLLSATLAMGLVVWYCMPEEASWLGMDWRSRAAALTLLCGQGVVAYVAVHLLMGSRPGQLRAPVSEL
jgi:putative peptidoglycan lipid II flippase